MRVVVVRVCGAGRQYLPEICKLSAIPTKICLMKCSKSATLREKGFNDNIILDMIEYKCMYPNLT